MAYPACQLKWFVELIQWIESGSGNLLRNGSAAAVDHLNPCREVPPSAATAGEQAAPARASRVKRRIGPAVRPNGSAWMGMHDHFSLRAHLSSPAKEAMPQRKGPCEHGPQSTQIPGAITFRAPLRVAPATVTAGVTNRPCTMLPRAQH